MKLLKTIDTIIRIICMILYAIIAFIPLAIVSEILIHTQGRESMENWLYYTITKPVNFIAHSSEDVYPMDELHKDLDKFF